ncbi:hypothetical protein E6C60_3315 [Paenibacillus algicola]|uniref:YetF C-terminal domain-containing protein n=1 Tax=Paenibacillus algicola TaxID=2565926 RepID=A0A4P8XMK1_9BACL|nr:YetF domain-containing protein [Paenibacillus algicola]QCT04026.1 hypothetical protein E6C60_3315 [Paenibacillus algicola]
MITVIWKAFLLATGGMLLLRISGRKSVSQMTIPQIGILLTIGSVLGSQVSGKGLSESLLAVAVFLATLVLVEWVSVKSNKAENLLKSRSVPVIQDGELLTDNMKRMRLTVDDLEKRLRLSGISRVEDVKTGTLENNGELGYELMPHAKPLTLGQFQQFISVNYPSFRFDGNEDAPTIFSEMIEPITHEVPETLQ